MSTVGEMRLLELLARGDAGAPALCAPERPPLSRGALALLIRESARALEAESGEGGRIALLLPNGPVAASAFLAASEAGTAAPLNPALKGTELELVLGHPNTRALLVPMEPTALPTPTRESALASAERNGLAIFELAEAAGVPAGAFTLRLRARGAARKSPGETSSAALLLHTSGTTARPKAVPLTHANLIASATAIAQSLALDTSDRCLQIMPLFHIHGLVAGLLASLGAGGAVSCTPGFNAFQFARWLASERPTWFTAVPTMLHALVALSDKGERGARFARAAREAKLRFVRSASAPLAPALLTELEALFSCPVLEAYGMTEAAHQMASNPFPPLARKPGSVGTAAGPELSVRGVDGAPCASDTLGEVAVRGPNVMSGYDENPEANAAAFFPGPERWFRTGDQGYLDAEGYLFLTGRLKELINRGGEKIAPREIDEALLLHPAVAQAVAFSLPHPALGEEVAAAVVLREGANATPQELRDHAALCLADFKVPRIILLLKELPMGPTGKPQRVGLAKQLGL